MHASSLANYFKVDDISIHFKKSAHIRVGHATSNLANSFKLHKQNSKHCYGYPFAYVQKLQAADGCNLLHPSHCSIGQNSYGS